MGRAFAFATAAVLATWCVLARAELRISAHPVLGEDATAQGWLEIATRIENTDPAPRRGVIELRATADERDEQPLVSEAAFSIGGGQAAVITLPTHGSSSGSPTFTLTVLDENRTTIDSSQINLSDRSDPLLFDVHHPSRLAKALRGSSMRLSYEPGGHRGWSSGHLLAIGEPPVDAATGEPLLPIRAAGLYGATAVLISSELLAHSSPEQMDALSGYVMAGGTIGIVLSRPEDLKQTTVTTLTGGPARVTGPQRGSLGPLAEPSPPEPGESDPLDPDAPDPFAPPKSSPPGHPLKGPQHKHPQHPGGSGASPPPAATPSPAAPSPAVLQALVGFEGGALRPSPYGASTPFGLGEVHLLAFDPTKAPGLDDPWVQARVVDLVRRAWDRRAPVVFPQGGPAPDPSAEALIGRQLDPSDGSLWSIILAALLLVAYGVAAGPLNFRDAKKRGAPLRALVRLPLFSAGATVIVLLVGFTAKGCSARARHLSLIEVGSGTPRGTARRFRAFFAPRGRSLTIHATDGSAVLDVAGERRDAEQRLSLDREGARLAHAVVAPWQTLTAREDGFATVGAGVSLVPKAGGSVTVTNRIGRTLRSAIVAIPGEPARYFPRIKDGESVEASAGALVGSISSITATSGSLVIHRFDAGAAHALDADTPGLTSAWTAVTTASGPYVDWFPDDRPVLLGEVEGGEGTTFDTSIELASDRTLLRVVGYGGTP